MSENCGIEISIGRDALCNGIEVEAAAVQPPEIGVEVRVMGDDGLTPHIGANGNWWIGETDTGVQAEGKEGPAGPQGERGIQGPQGPQGEPGRDGATGSQGPQGEQGPAGETGAQGPMGPQGIQGPKGDKGETGADGQTGPQGPAGKDGAPGADGQPGTPGDPGFSPTVSVEDITGGHRVTITDAEGDKSFDVMDGKDGEGGDGGGAAIIDVVELPTENINEDVFYRLPSGTFYYNGIPQADWTLYIVEALPAQGVPVTTDMVHVALYYAADSGAVSGYIPDALSGMVGVPAGWYPAEALAQAFGLGWGGIIWNESEDPADNASRLLLNYRIYQHKQGKWYDLSEKVGWRGEGNGSEVFNTLRNVASGEYSHAEGSGTSARGNASHAEGGSTTASGSVSHAEGSGTTASGEYSHAEGGSTSARGYCSHAEGSGTTASGEYSHAEGYNTTASDYCSHAEGSGTTASGEVSHAEGYSTFASGGKSHAEGGSTTASGEYSHAEGYSTLARGASQHVQGEYNLPDIAPSSYARAKYAHIVGNGKGDYNRSNAHTLDWDGVGWFAGGVKVGGTGQDDEASDWLVSRNELEGLLGGSGETIPDYVISEADSVIDRIAAAQRGRTFTFAAITDMHFGQGEYTDGVKHACQALKYIDERIKLDAVAVLGDYTDGYADRDGQYENAIADFREVNSVLSDLRFAPNLRMHGNHDYIEGRMPEIFRYTAAYSAEDAVWGGGSYFYRDFGRCKLRIICLDTVGDDTGNVGYTDEQAQWFAGALDLSGKADAADWQVLVLSHHPVDFNHAEGNPYRFAGIIEAYTKGASYASGNVSCNFAGKNAATFVGNIHGHIHNLLVDRIYKDGVYSGSQINALRIATPEACFGRENGYDGIWKEEITYSKTKNTAEDTSFVVYCINLDAKTIEAVCYGAGYDRTIEYNIGGGETGGYTNQIPIAIDQNGNTVVDGAMYKDSRWSSSGAVSSAPGYFITGLIPAKPGDFVRVRWNNTELYGDTGYQCVRAFGADRTPIDSRLPFQYMFDPSNEAGAAFTSEEGFYYDFANGVLDFRVLAYSSIPAGTEYLTFVLSGDPAEAIITVNEEITTE